MMMIVIIIIGTPKSLPFFGQTNKTRKGISVIYFWLWLLLLLLLCLVDDTISTVYN
jgi:hypothetical protein